MRVLALSGGTRWGQDAVQCVVADSTLLKAAARGQVEAALAICALVGAKSNGSSSSSDSAMDTTVNILTVCDSAGCAPAALAAENGHWLLAWMLVREAGAPLLTEEDDDSSTTTSALAKAVEFGDRIHQLVQTHREHEKAKQEQANARASNDAGPRVIHVDDNVEEEEEEGACNDAIDVGNNRPMTSEFDLLSQLVRGNGPAVEAPSAVVQRYAALLALQSSQSSNARGLPQLLLPASGELDPFQQLALKMHQQPPQQQQQQMLRRLSSKKFWSRRGAAPESDDSLP